MEDHEQDPQGEERDPEATEGDLGDNDSTQEPVEGSQGDDPSREGFNPDTPVSTSGPDQTEGSGVPDIPGGENDGVTPGDGSGDPEAEDEGAAQQ